MLTALEEFKKDNLPFVDDYDKTLRGILDSIKQDNVGRAVAKCNSLIQLLKFNADPFHHIPVLSDACRRIPHDPYGAERRIWRCVTDYNSVASLFRAHDRIASETHEQGESHG